jgi:hypothetical protein
MERHQFIFDRQSKVIFNGEELEIEVYKCIACEKLYILDSKTGLKISLDGMMGEEV